MSVQVHAEGPGKPIENKAIRPTRQQLILTISRVWSWLFLGFLVVYFSSEGTGFFSIRNSQNILVAIVPILLMGLGQTFVIIAAGIDLSVGWVMGLSSVTSAVVMRDLTLDTRPELFTTLFEYAGNFGVSLEVCAIFCGFLAGMIATCLAGLLNGVVIAKLHVPAFIVTLGVSFIARGLAWIISNGNTVGGQPATLRRIGNDSLLYWVRGENGGLYFLEKPDVTGEQLRGMERILHWPVIIMFIITFIAIFLLRNTRFGRHTYAIGGNLEASARAGIPVARHTIKLYVLSAFTAGLAGFLFNARFVGGSADAGDALMLMSIAAVVIGGASMFGGQGYVSGTMIGALILAVLQTGLIIIDVPTYWQYITVGVIVIMAVLIDQARDLIIGRAESL